MFYYGGCGTADGFYAAQQAVQKGILAAGAESVWDSWQGAGHGDPVWSDFWNPSWISPAMGVGHYKKITQLSPVAQPAAAPPVSTPPVVAAPKTIKSILITYSDGSTSSLP